MAAPNLPVLIYDGGCGFCTRSARWIERRFRPGSPARVAPWQEVDLAALGLTEADVRAAAWWVDEGGRRRRGHAAIAAGLRACRGGWRAVGAVLALPLVSTLAGAVYAWVARNRHRIPTR